MQDAHSRRGSRSNAVKQRQAPVCSGRHGVLFVAGVWWLAGFLPALRYLPGHAALEADYTFIVAVVLHTPPAR